MSRDQYGRAGRLLEPTIRRYAKDVRRRLRKMARGSSRLGDVIIAWPAAAYALAVGRGEVADRGDAVRLIKAGASLREVGAVLSLPQWTRRLPPEAFRQGFGALPDGPEAGVKLATLRPEEPVETMFWFEWIVAAQAVGGPDVALWAAREREQIVNRRLPPALMAPIGAWIWVSSHPEALGARAAARGWTPAMRLRSACRETLGWLERLLEVYAASRRREKPGGSWFKAQNVSGFKISPRQTPEELIREGQVMNHCVGTYAGLVQKGVCLIYSIRRGGVPVATVEIRARPDGSGRGYIAQLQGPSNTPVDPKVWRAVETWLRRQGACPVRSSEAPRVSEIDPDRWSALVDPLRADPQAGGVFGGLFPAAPTDEALFRLARLQGGLRRAAEG